MGVNLLVGRLDPERAPAGQAAAAREAVRECGTMAAASGRTVLIEHLNPLDVPGYLLPTPADAAAFVASVGLGSVRLLYDAYHAAAAGLDPCEDVGRHAPIIGHVQYADWPGRGAPGTGRVDLTRFVDRLGAAGYGGAVGLEYDPGGATLDSLGFLRSLASG
jgi:hydroxypyruvate isomerase